ncbi:MAG TPA: Do family serine endopeptidase [Thermoanaerobaculia bacterium]|nr:Do family serine endopeptidase [Thermoanaerobaculia bacterium]
MKRNLSIFAIIIASVAFGIILTADLGWMKSSRAQEPIQTTQGAVPSVTIPSFATVAERVMPAVVSITTTEVFNRSERRGGGVDPFEFFFPNPRRDPQRNPEDDQGLQRSGGSGFIISPDGYVVTNNHVIEGATRVQVQYGDEGRSVTAKVVGTDPATDLALLKIDVDGPLPTVPLGDSSAIRVGDWALAIGNPLQFENTLTVGVISAKNRSLGISATTQSFENFIQTDAAINYGNSGGPLLNINGEAVGINTAIRASAQNLGFATPVNVLKRILPQLREKGSVTRSFIGINVRDVDQDRAEAFNLPSISGAFVEAVSSGAPAEKAGVLHGDVVVKVDDIDVRRTRDLIDYVSDQPPGTRVQLEVIRDGKRRSLNAVTAERPPDGAEVTPSRTAPDAPAQDKLGISIQELTPALARQHRIDENARGVVVTNVKEVSPAGESNLAAGDLITQVNGQAVTTVARFREIVDRQTSGQLLRIYVTRYGRAGQSQSFFAIIRVP